MKTMIFAALTLLTLSIGSAYAQPNSHQPAPSLQTFDAGWANG
jgi:hypothetical protein